MTPEQLKGSILQAAIKGKLSSQSNADSNVDEALEKMRRQREELINEGKLKKEGRINKTADTEIDIPSTWRLVPLKELVCKRVDNRGKTPPHSQVKTPNECIDLLEIASIVPGKSIDHSRVEKFVTKETYNQQRGFVEKDDILIATVGSIGKFALMDDTKSAVAQNIIAIKCFDIVDQHYVFYLLQSPYFYSAMGCIKMEAVQASIKVPDLMNLNVPLPPIEEQHRIVAKIEELLPYVDRYAEAYEKLEQFNAKFPEDMKKSILQYAIQGKLVEQRPEEGTAEELYQQIQEEKQRLIKAGKIKKEKPLAEITDDEIPFDIPESWRWIKFGEIYNLTNGLASRGKAGNPMCPVLRLADLSNNCVTTDNVRLLRIEEKEKLSHLVKKGDLIFIRVNGSRERVGRAYFYDGDEEISYCDHLFCGHALASSIDVKFIQYIFNSYFNRCQLKPEIKTTAGQNTISQESMKNIILPLPPHREQQRIVAKIEELLPLCDRLAK